MKSFKTLFLLGLFLTFTLAITGCEETPITPAGNNIPNPPATEDAPDFSLTSVSGTTVSLADFSDKPLVIFFFGSSCTLCKGSAPSIESGIAAKFDSKDVGIIGIDTWDGNLSAVNSFKNTTGVTFDLLLNGSTVENAYNITYDRLLVVDKNGKIAFKGKSSASNDVNDVVKLLEDLLM